MTDLPAKELAVVEKAPDGSPGDEAVIANVDELSAYVEASVSNVSLRTEVIDVSDVVADGLWEPGDAVLPTVDEGRKEG